MNLDVRLQWKVHNQKKSELEIRIGNLSWLVERKSQMTIGKKEYRLIGGGQYMMVIDVTNEIKPIVSNYHRGDPAARVQGGYTMIHQDQAIRIVRA